MRVRVKPGKKYFYGDVLYDEGEEFTIKEREHSVNVDDKGNPVIISIESQFSAINMEKIEEAKPKGRPGPKPKKDTEQDN